MSNLLNIARATRKYAVMRARMLANPSQKLAPGPFNPFEPGRFPHPRCLLEKAQTYGPVFKFSWQRNLSTAIIGFEAAQEFLAQNDAHLSGISQDLSPLGEVKHLRNLEGSVHRHCKHHATRAVPRAGIDAREADLRVFIRHELGALVKLSAERWPSPHDLEQALRSLATGMLITTLFGVRPGSEPFKALLESYLKLGPEGIVWTIGPAQVATYAEIENITSRLAGGLSEEQLSDPASGFLREFSRARPDDRLVLVNLLSMIEMGRHDLAALFRWIVSIFSEQQQIVDQLAQMHSADADHFNAFAEATVLETLRHVQSESLARKADRDIVFKGHLIPRGSYVRICLWETHKDPDTFPDPFRFDPNRFLAASYDTASFAPFGLDRHRCVAAEAVVRLATLFVQELARGYEWHTRGNTEPVHLFSLWEPSPDFTIRLEERGAQPPKAKI